MFLLRSFPLEKENVAYLQFNPSESTKKKRIYIYTDFYKYDTKAEALQLKLANT